MSGALRPVPGGLLVRLRVTPGASRSGLSLDPAAPPERQIRARVGAPPEKGKANAAVLALAAKAWALPKASLSVASGAHSRDKTLHIEGETDAIAATIAAWMASQGERAP